MNERKINHKSIFIHERGKVGYEIWSFLSASFTSKLNIRKKEDDDGNKMIIFMKKKMSFLKF